MNKNKFLTEEELKVFKLFIKEMEMSCSDIGKILALSGSAVSHKFAIKRFPRLEVREVLRVVKEKMIKREKCLEELMRLVF